MAWLAASALVVTLAVAAEPAQAAAAPVDPATTTELPVGPLVRPDAVSARVSALASGERVEVEALRDEFSSTWVNPDGTSTTEAHAGQQRFRDPATGEWRDVDLDLATAADGDVVAKAHPQGLRLRGRQSAAGEVDLVSLGHGKSRGGKGKDGRVRDRQDRSLSLAWAGRLPKPVLEGQRATYPDVQPGVDLVVESRRSGFEQFFVLDDADTLPASGPVSWSFTLRTRGLTPRVEGDGSVSFTDPDGVVVSTIPPALAWDAVVDETSGDPANVAPVALTVTARGNKTTITVTPDAGWLSGCSR